MREATVRRLAGECGFELVGVAAATPLVLDADLYLDWVSRGLAGRMSYLTDRRAELRSDPKNLLPSAKSIICLGKLYDPSGSGEPIARYAQGPDYHDTLRERLERLVEELRQAFGDFDYKICIDTAPLLERSYARAAGLGWIGRNTCLINEQLGSWLFLAEILVSLELTPGVPAPDRCGTCTRCIDACPTEALRPGGFGTELDATRCISYFTIELKGGIPEQHRTGVGTHAFGCDICQEVCPWNRDEHGTEPGPSLEELAGLTPDAFRSRFRDTPVWRSRYSGFLRNVVVAMGNSGDRRYRSILERLAGSDDSLVATHSAWALSKLE